MPQYLPQIFYGYNAEEIFPNYWKDAKIIPVPKIKDPASFSILKPLNILPALSKIFSYRIICAPWI